MLFKKIVFVFNLLIFSLLIAKPIGADSKTNVPYPLDVNQNKTIEKLFSDGMNEYSKHEYTKAIDIWKKVLIKAKNSKNKDLIIKTTINLGATYNSIGFHKTAVEYFIKAKSIMQSSKNEETYWINNLNIGVCYMSLDQLELAKKYFDATKEINPYVSFIKKLNTAKWYGLKDRKAVFFNLKNEVTQSAKNYPIYVSIWNEVQLDFLIKWNDVYELKILLNQLNPDYESSNLYLKLLLNKANLIANKRTFTSLNNLFSYEKMVLESKDLYLKNLYYEVLKEYYYSVKNIDLYYKYSNLWEANNELLNIEKNMLHVKDFDETKNLLELKNRFTETQIKSQLIQNQLSKSDLKLKLSVLIILMSISIILLLIRNYNKKKKVQQIHILESQNKLLKEEIEKALLSETLKETKEELNYSVLNIKKVALLKKQLENIADDNKPGYDEKEALKRLKICLNTFFDNYRELNELIHEKLQVDQIVAKAKVDFPTLSNKELKVIEWIALKFTTKEIALLMDKSEKSVEYYRTQIRKKLCLSNDCSIEQYFNKMI
jgi:DNA-binding CsgD family transcriptional regulator